MLRQYSPIPLHIRSFQSQKDIEMVFCVNGAKYFSRPQARLHKRLWHSFSSGDLSPSTPAPRVVIAGTACHENRGQRRARAGHATLLPGSGAQTAFFFAAALWTSAAFPPGECYSLLTPGICIAELVMCSLLAFASWH